MIGTTYRIVNHNGTAYRVDGDRPVVITNVYGQAYRGRIVAVTDDFVELRTPSGRPFHMRRVYIASAHNTPEGN